MPLTEQLRYARLSSDQFVDTIDAAIPAWSGLDDDVILRVITRDGKPVSVEIIDV